jgi:hypothetical protein
MSLVDEARTVRQRIADRLAELEPLVREYEELRQLAAEMGVEQASTGGSSGARTSEIKPSRAGRTRRSSSSKGRRKSVPNTAPPGELAQRVMEVVRSEPGKTVAEYAADLQVAPTALYRPVRQLTTAGDVIKRARQLFPA